MKPTMTGESFGFQPSSEPASPEQLRAVYDSARQWLIAHGLPMPNANPLGNQGWARDDMTGEDLPILAEEDSLTAIIFAESVHALLPETAAALELGHDEISLFFCPRCAKKSRRPDGGVEIFDSKLVVDIPKSGLYDREGLILVEEPNGTVTGERQLEMDGVGVVDLSAWDKDSVTINVIEQRALLDIVTNLDTLAAH